MARPREKELVNVWRHHVPDRLGVLVHPVQNALDSPRRPPEDAAAATI